MTIPNLVQEYLTYLNILTMNKFTFWFNWSFISAVNYGTTGFVIGHELSHSFDNEGIILLLVFIFIDLKIFFLST